MTLVEKLATFIYCNCLLPVSAREEIKYLLKRAVVSSTRRRNDLA